MGRPDDTEEAGRGQARQVIARLGLAPHPEGGHFREIYRHHHHESPDARGHVTSIYYLLEAGQVSHWHRIDAVELWHFHAGAPLELTIVKEGKAPLRYRLGIDLEADERPQATVPAKAWQSARSLGAWSLVSCTVAPAFDFAGFELAPPGWSPSA
jgi:predicted cupin superfamily sugar epimerase